MGGMVKGLDLLVMYYYMVGFYKNLSVALKKKGDLLNFIISRDKQVSGKSNVDLGISASTTLLQSVSFGLRRLRDEISTVIWMDNICSFASFLFLFTCVLFCSLKTEPRSFIFFI